MKKFFPELKKKLKQLIAENNYGKNCARIGVNTGDDVKFPTLTII